MKYFCLLPNIVLAAHSPKILFFCSQCIVLGLAELSGILRCIYPKTSSVVSGPNTVPKVSST